MLTGISVFLLKKGKKMQNPKLGHKNPKQIC